MAFAAINFIAQTRGSQHMINMGSYRDFGRTGIILYVIKSCGQIGRMAILTIVDTLRRNMAKGTLAAASYSTAVQIRSVALGTVVKIPITFPEGATVIIRRFGINPIHQCGMTAFTTTVASIARDPSNSPLVIGTMAFLAGFPAAS